MAAKNCGVDVSAVVCDRTVGCCVVLGRLGEASYMEKCFVGEHSFADALGEFLDLFLDVAEERVGAPASDEHDCVDGFSGEVGHHREGGSDGVSADLAAGEAEDVRSDAVHRGTDVDDHFPRGYLGEGVPVEEGEDRPGGVEARVRTDSAYCLDPVDDGVEFWVSVVVLGYLLVADVRFLVSEVDRDAVREVEAWVVVGDDAVAEHESDVADFDWSRLALLADVSVLAASHREEQGTAEKVRPGPGARVPGHAEAIPEHYGGHGLLVVTWGVGAPVTRRLPADVLVDVSSAV